jgi:hypothetical protein
VCVAVGARNLIQCLNQTSWWDKGKCRPPAGLAIIASQFSPYLYPFTIEYSILVGESHTTHCSGKYLNSERTKREVNAIYDKPCDLYGSSYIVRILKYTWI